MNKNPEMNKKYMVLAWKSNQRTEYSVGRSACPMGNSHR
jgi:hypothetical protein